MQAVKSSGRNMKIMSLTSMDQMVLENQTLKKDILKEQNIIVKNNIRLTQNDFTSALNLKGPEQFGWDIDA
jgi:hypothetical protein